MLHAMGKSYGCRPSSFLEDLNELEAFIVDEAAIRKGVAAERQATAEAEDETKRKAEIAKHRGR